MHKSGVMYKSGEKFVRRGKTAKTATFFPPNKEKAFSLAKPEEIVETVVWKRYNDFKKLHKALYQLHYNLRRPEKFPVFAKAKFFGRFDDDVVEERRQSALNLLEFVVKIAPLTRSNFFRNFFEGGEEVSINQSPPAPILKPKVLAPSSVNGTSRSRSPPSWDSASSNPSEGRELAFSEGQSSSPSLGGVWLHRQNEEDITEYGTVDYDDDDDDRTTFSEDSVPSTPLPQLQDMSLFDPLSDTEPCGPAKYTSVPQSNSWLFQAMDMCAVLNEDSSQDSPDNSTPANSTTDLSTDSGITINFPKGPDTSSTATTSPREQARGGTEVPSDSVEDQKNDRNTMARAYLHCIRAQQAAERDAMYPGGGMVDSRSPDVKPRLDGIGGVGVGPVTVGGEEDYLYQAAGHISLALENEANGSYQAAFDLYKSGVGVLLKGVIADDNKNRREAVRRKTAQYLMKAEDLYNKYLSADATNSKRWESEQPSIDVDPRSAHLRGSQEELKNYKVLGLIDSVLLVLDTVTYQTFVIKVLVKSSTPTKRASYAPANCRYVVKPYRFIETDDAIFVVLEHASGGKLWSYASAFLNRGTESSLNQAVAGSLERKSIGSCGSRRSRHSTASGREDQKFQEEIDEESVFAELGDPGGVTLAPPPAHRFGNFVSSAHDSPGDSDFTSGVSPGGENSYANLIIDYGENSHEPTAGDGAGFSKQDVMEPAPLVVTDSISRELDDLDIQDTEANLNDLANQCSQYDGFAGCNGVSLGMLSGTDLEKGKSKDRLNEAATAPMNLFSIDSIESSGSELHSASSADKTVFGFGTPPASPKVESSDGDGLRTDRIPEKKTSLTMWVEHNPEDVIADALKVMEDLEKDNLEDFRLDTESLSYNIRSSEFDEFNARPPNTGQLDTLPDTSGFASAMTDDVTSSKPGTDLAEFFDTGSVEDARTCSETKRPPLVRHSVSMYESGTHSDSPLRQRQHSNPLDLRVTRRASLEGGRSDDSLSSLLRVKVEEPSGFESLSLWEAKGRAVTESKTESHLGEILCKPTPDMLTGDRKQVSSTAVQSEVHPNQPGQVPPRDVSLVTPNNPYTASQVHSNPAAQIPAIQPPVHPMKNLSPMSNLEGSEVTIYSSCESTPKHAIYSPDYDSGTVMDSPNMESPNPSSTNGQGLVGGTHEYSNTNGMKDSLGDNDTTPTHHTAALHPGNAAMTSNPKPKPRDAPLPSLTTLFAQMDEQVTVTKSSTLPESCVRLWAAEILLALTDLHATGIICQDLHPDNILLAEGGHIRLTYFSQWQYVESSLSAHAKEHFYTAPEVNGIFSVTPACDWWSFGVLLFELLTGTSLHSCHPSGLSSHTQLNLPDHISPEAASLLKQLLQVNPLERLGSHRAGGAEEIRLHPFFKDINWTSLQKTAHS
ncbi:ribosomal protein S6 kinase delta-1-like isoform X2 [Acanthaster planci]|uniref:Ribosomal protein S6 kinase delta-1-like isoform X2 n=1 Tax=Acanthaster planci TaxID=133434 RepID=A0A8B7ZE68_ACAPL|nr:ribosomal protein S6 kinase delta-1-like isoform X2 [Acanthaster planci]